MLLLNDIQEKEVRMPERVADLLRERASLRESPLFLCALIIVLTLSHSLSEEFHNNLSRIETQFVKRKQ